MALFGSSRKNSFGQSPYGTPPYIENPTVGAGMPQQQETPAPRRGGLFGQGGVGRNIAGAIGDFLVQRAGGSPIYGPAAEQQRQMQLNEQVYQRRRQDALEDWTTQKQWERDNPKPENKTALQQNYEYLKGMNPRLAETYLQNQSNPVQAIPGFDEAGNRTMTFMRPSLGAPASQTPPEFLTDDDFGPAPMVQGGQGGPIGSPPQIGANFMTRENEQAMIQSMGLPAYQAWQRQHRVPVR